MAKSIAMVDLDGFESGAVVVDYNGEGNEQVVFSSEENIGLDRSVDVTFSTTRGEPSVEVTRTVVQLGLREQFAGADGEFSVADGGTFHVLKENV